MERVLQEGSDGCDRRCVATGLRPLDSAVYTYTFAGLQPFGVRKRCGIRLAVRALAWNWTRRTPMTGVTHAASAASSSPGGWRKRAGTNTLPLVWKHRSGRKSLVL